MNKYKIIFFGTSEFAVPALEALAGDKNFEINLIVTQPDAPQGRKKTLTPTPVKVVAEKLNLKIFAPEKIKDENALERVCNLKADFLVLAAYGKILPDKILKCAKYGAVNIHPSLLPKYRGPSPVQYALLSGEKETGVSIILMDEEIDHGPILTQSKLNIEPDETADELKSRLSKLAAKLLPEVLIKFAKNELKPTEQDHPDVTFSKILNREDGRIDWKKSAKEIYNMWRAFYPWPGIFTELTLRPGSGQEIFRIKLTKIKKTTSDIYSNVLQNIGIAKFEDGKLFSADKKLFVKCGDGIIEIEKLQLEGKKELSAKEFLQGHKVIVGLRLT